MTSFWKRICAALLSLSLVLPATVKAQSGYSQAELDQMLAPVALYPDPLLSQVLMAATYPLEVVEAARWTRANPHLKGDDAVRAVQSMDWDPSVKSLVAFPHLLQRMDEQLDWTQSLGDAFLAQEPQVMETVQGLRQRAYAAGHLRSNEYLHVQQQGPVYVVQPVRAHVVYVPYYDPLVVYGPWWWPAYRPVVWAPWPGYARPARSGVSVSFWWGAPVAVSAGFFFGNVNWRERQVHVVRHQHVHYQQHVTPGRWQHNPQHRRGIEYRHAAVRQQFTASAPKTAAEARRADDRDDRHMKFSRPQAQPRAQPQPRPQARPQQEERWQERREERAERKQERVERKQESRGGAKGKGHERRESRDERGHKNGERS